jgi:uncharacterized membrane protein
MTLLGRRMCAVAFIAFGLLQFLYGDFVPGRPPAWPDQFYGRLIWAYASGAWFVVAGAAILVDRYTRPAALSTAALVFAWAVTRNLPIALADASFGGAWTRLGKAVALSGGALAIAASARQRAQRSTFATFGGVALIAGGVGLMVRRTAPVAGVSVALMVFTWTCILHIPRAIAAVPANRRNEWTAVFEALAFAGLALVLASKRQ